MIQYNEWVALCASDPAKANAICAERMGWVNNEASWYWFEADGFTPAMDEDRWSPITSRVHATMMVKTVAKSGHQCQLDFTDNLCAISLQAVGRWPLLVMEVLLIDLRVLTYCACVALEKA